MDRDRSVPAGDGRSAIAPLGVGVELRRGARAGAPRAPGDRARRAFRAAALAGRVMDELARAIEATLCASASPLSADEIALHVGEGEVDAALRSLADHYGGRGIELVERGGRWHCQTAPDLAHLLRRTREEP